MENKIGQIIVAKEDFKIETALGGNSIEVKKGDKAFIDSKGFVHYTSGNARGKIHLAKDSKPNGYAHEDIAELIFKRLNANLNLSEMLEDYDIECSDFKAEIENTLMDIL